jgi:outer membrane receptor protein involved in Fe transport
VKKYQQTRLLAGVAPVVLGAALFAAPAFAQDSGDAGAEASDAIVVTGSRIARPDLDSVVPVAVLDSTSLERDAAVNIQDVLQEMPQVGIGNSRTNSNFLTGANGVATINLRNLGSSRTLVLVNGRRFIAGIGGTSAVDINNIPTDFIERVDITTGGASSIYGSDAVAGVVNFIMKDRFEGIRVRGQYNITEKGDNPRYFTSITAGTSWGADDRGSIIANFSYDKDTGLLSRNRAMSAEDCYFDICGPAAYSSYSPQGRFELLDANGAAVNGFNGGSLFSFDNENNVIAGGGAGYNRNAVRRISVPVERYLASTILNYEVSDNIKAFTEVTYAKTKSSSKMEASALATEDIYASAAAGIPITNAFIPQSVREQIDAYNLANPDAQISTIGFRRRQNEVFDRSNNASRDTWRVAAGLKGDINDKWQFEASYVYGKLRDYTGSEDIDNNRYRNALDSILDAEGNIVCRSEAARAEGCQPINIFGFNTASPEASAYVQAVVPKSTLIKQSQHVLSGVISGSPFALPAGDVGVAFGAEYRKEKSIEDLDILTNTGGNSGNQIPDTAGNFNVWEVFGEVNVPLLRDTKFAENLSVGGAVRYSDYSQRQVGGVLSWSVNGDWTPVRGLSFRSTYSVANRAPNISEFASAPSETFASVNDPCQGVTLTRNNEADAACRAIPAIAAAIADGGAFEYSLSDQQGINGFVGGNPNLSEEKAKTLTVGAVIQPEALRGFSLTVDYFNIKVQDAISTVARNESIKQCLLLGDAAFCDNVYRNANTGRVTRVDAQLINVADLSTSGIDVGVRYNTPLNLWGEDRLELSGNYTYLINYKVQDNPATPVRDFAGTVGQSEHRASARAAYLKGPLTFSWQVNYLSKAIGDLDFVGDDTVYGDTLTLDQMNKVGDRWYHDIQARLDIGEDKEFGIYAGVDNLFNSKPPFLPGTPFTVGITGTETAADVYDVFGRRFYVGASVRF